MLPGLILSIAGPMVDFAATGIRLDEWLSDNCDLPLVTGVVVTSLLGVMVNITAYWAIKTNGAVTYQVRQIKPPTRNHGDTVLYSLQ
jgi:hypothetical protein